MSSSCAWFSANSQIFFTGFLVALIYFAPYYFHTSLRFVYVSHYITVFLLFIMYFNHIIVILFACVLSFFLFSHKKKNLFSFFCICFLIDFLYSLGVTPIAFFEDLCKIVIVRNSYLRCNIRYPVFSISQKITGNLYSHSTNVFGNSHSKTVI